MAFLYLIKSLIHSLNSPSLEIEATRCEDLQTIIIKFFFAIFSDYITANYLSKIRRKIERTNHFFCKVQRFFPGFGVLFFRNESCFKHATQHSQLFLPGEFLVLEWVEASRTGHQSSYHRRFGNRKMDDRFVEVAPSRSLHAVASFPKVDLVEVNV